MNKIRDILFGCAVGDALGVPFEFKRRGEFKCSGMSKGGAHNQLEGTWSDDTSMTLCLADCIADGFSYEKLAENFLAWFYDGKYTAGGSVFDIGYTTEEALKKIRHKKCPALMAGGKAEDTNGNGSLMRIAPLALYTKDMDIKERFEICKNVSSITHAHQISVSACFIFTEFLRALILGAKVENAFNAALETKESLIKLGIEKVNVEKFSGFNSGLKNLPEDEISSGGYVVDTLTASFWCILNTGSYKDAVLEAVNLGRDTDTTAAVTGSAAGLIYGADSIPADWMAALKNKELIESIAGKF